VAKGTVLFQKGYKAEKIVIILEGRLVDGEGNEVAGKGSIFGDRYLWNKNKDKPVESDILMGSDGVLS
jgi:hypothetical protein